VLTRVWVGFRLVNAPGGDGVGAGVVGVADGVAEWDVLRPAVCFGVDGSPEAAPATISRVTTPAVTLVLGWPRHHCHTRVAGVAFAVSPPSPFLARTWPVHWSPDQ
jgi:hypothetical protein